MSRYLLRRLVGLIPVLALVLVIVFCLTRFIPGDPAVTLLGPGATAEQIAALRRQMHLDQPQGVQFLSYVWNLLHGDLGVSLKTGRPVLDELASKLPATIELALAALLIALAIGIPAGVAAARRRGGVLDQVLRVAALACVSVPAFLIAFALQGLFGSWLRFLPVAGRLSPYFIFKPITGFAVLDALLHGDVAALSDAIRHLLLPATVLGLFIAANLSRFVRSAMIQQLDEDYVRTARAKGLDERQVVYGHALPNALIPVLSVIAILFGDMLGGAILTETIFSWPGVGRYTLDAIRNRDYPVVQSATLIFAAMFMLVSLAIDVIGQRLDPRLKAPVA